MSIKLKLSKILKRFVKKSPDFSNVLYLEFIAVLFEIINDGELEKASRYIVNLYMEKHNNNYELAKSDLFENLKNSTIKTLIEQRFSGVFAQTATPNN